MNSTKKSKFDKNGWGGGGGGGEGGGALEGSKPAAEGAPTDKI